MVLYSCSVCEYFFFVAPGIMYVGLYFCVFLNTEVKPGCVLSSFKIIFRNYETVRLMPALSVEYILQSPEEVAHQVFRCTNRLPTNLPWYSALSQWYGWGWVWRGTAAHTNIGRLHLPLWPLFDIGEIKLYGRLAVQWKRVDLLCQEVYKWLSQYLWHPTFFWSIPRIVHLVNPWHNYYIIYATMGTNQPRSWTFSTEANYLIIQYTVHE